MKPFLHVIVIALLNFFPYVSLMPMWQPPPANAGANSAPAPAPINSVELNPGDVYKVYLLHAQEKQDFAIFVKKKGLWHYFYPLCVRSGRGMSLADLDEKIPGLPGELRDFSEEKAPGRKYEILANSLRVVIPNFPSADHPSMAIGDYVGTLKSGKLVVEYAETTKTRKSDVTFINANWDKFTHQISQHTTAGTSSGSGPGSSSVAVHLPVQPPSGFQFIAENWDESTRQMGQDIRAGTFSGSGPGSSSAVVHLPIQPPSVSHSTLPPSPNQRPRHGGERRPRHREKYRHRPYTPGNPTVDIPNPNPGSVGVIRVGLPPVSSGPSSRSNRVAVHPRPAPPQASPRGFACWLVPAATSFLHLYD